MAKYTAHYSGRARAWKAVIKLNGRRVWESADTFRNRDTRDAQGLGALPVANDVCVFLNDPTRGAALLRWHEKHGRGNSLHLTKWAIDTADVIRAQEPGGDEVA